MQIMDLVEAVAPGCDTVDIGIRPGEKLHELMIPADDARRTLEFSRHYVICPDLDYWNPANYPDGCPVADRFQYSSDTNREWLTVDRMREMLVALGLERSDVVETQV
jgi:UDP-N-acetylglucosamine 4,6-dehydratase